MSENSSAATVAHALAAHSDGITARELAEATGLRASTVHKALTSLEADGTAHRTPGASNGRRKAADLWRPATRTSGVTPDTETSDADAAPDTDLSVASADTVPTDQPGRQQGAEAAQQGAESAAERLDSAPSTEPTGEQDNGSTPDTRPAPVPVPEAATGTPRQPDLKVQIMAGVLTHHPDGLPAADAIAEAGLATNTGDIILAAMEIAGAARRLPVTDDGVELWVRGEADLSTVDPANAPTHVTCPTCGHTRRIRRPSARRPRTRGDHNGNGVPRLAKNGLRHQVEAFLRGLGAGHDVTPGTVARELGGRSSGAVGNAMARLTATGVLTITHEAPVMYALAANPPAPSPEVAALMATPVVTVDAEATATSAG
jgi:MarR family protein